MTTLILVVGCAFIAGMVAAFASGSFFLSVMVALMLSGQTLAMYCMKLGSQTGDWFIFLALPLMFIAAMTGGGIGMVIADPAYDSGINPNDIV
ncbi:MAG: hypothetical protein H6R01_1158 [Burkholderiaceae bacterium]|nr:hypothetical protein [Burkholderiaceae bacterium]